MQDSLKNQPVVGVAKNVIIFLGDGMGVSTVTGGRILKGQLQNKTGEETVLSWEKFPNVALSKVMHGQSMIVCFPNVNHAHVKLSWSY